MIDLQPSQTAFQTPTPGRPPSTLRSIFLGRHGLRSGWSLAVYILLIALLFSLMVGAMHLLIPPAPRTHSQKPLTFAFTLINEGGPLLLVCLATWIMSRIERRPMSTYGSGGTHKLRHLAAGLFWGVICLSVLVAALWRTHLLVVDGRQLFGASILRFAAEWGVAFLFVALFEEYFLRGYLQFTLARALASLYTFLFKTPRAPALGFWTAAFLLSAVFGLGHRGNAGESPIGLLSAGIAGLVFCLALWRTGSLWWAIGFHATWDWAQSFLYGVADSGTMVQQHLLATHPLGSPLLSGGTTGPEGSIYILPVMALIAAIILLTTTRRPTPIDGPSDLPPGDLATTAI